MHAFISEGEDRDPDDHAVLSGRFFVTGPSDGGEGRAMEEFGSLEAAIAWAEDHADVVHVEFEEQRYLAAGGRDFPPLAPVEMQRAALGRRRRPGEEWLDRTELDEPVLWLVKAEIHPGTLTPPGPERDAQQRVLDQVETELAEAGLQDVWISSDGLDATLAEIDEQYADKEEGWHGIVVAVPSEFELHATALTRTWRAAVALVVQTTAQGLFRATGRAAWTYTTQLPLYEAGWGVSAIAWPVEGQPPRPAPI